MYLDLLSLLSGLQRQLNVTLYNISPQQIVTDIQMLPGGSEAKDLQLRQDVLYICGYRQLSRYHPQLRLAPLICVVEPKVLVNSSLFLGRCVAVVTGSTVLDTMQALLHAIYCYEGRSSPIVDISQRLLRCNGLEELFQEGSQILGNPMVLTTREHKILAFTDPSEVSSPAYRDIVAQDDLPAGAPSADPDSSLSDPMNVRLIETGDTEGCSAILIKKLYAVDQFHGYLHVMAFDRAFTQDDIYTTELLADLLAIQLARTTPKHLQLDLDQQAIQFLRDLLDSVSGDTEQTIRRMQALDVTFTEHLYAMVVQNRPGSSLHPPSQFNSFYALSRSISGLFPGGFSFLYKDSIFVLLNCDREIEDLAAYLAPIFRLPNTANLQIGVSNHFSSVLSIREYAYQARNTIHLGGWLHPEQQLFLFQNYALYHMAELCLRSERAEELCSPALARLVAYCQRNGNELLDTLRVYLKCRCSKLNTSKKMFIHVNTIKYRIAQIQEIMGVDLSQQADVLWLEMSLILLDFQDSARTLPLLDNEAPQ